MAGATPVWVGSRRRRQAMASPGEGTPSGTMPPCWGGSLHLVRVACPDRMTSARRRMSVPAARAPTRRPCPVTQHERLPRASRTHTALLRHAVPIRTWSRRASSGAPWCVIAVMAVWPQRRERWAPWHEHPHTDVYDGCPHVLDCPECRPGRRFGFTWRVFRTWVTGSRRQRDGCRHAEIFCRAGRR
jgi:hypothetical protein